MNIPVRTVALSSAKTQGETQSGAPILFAVRALPIEAFGSGHGQRTRKLVLTILASYANSDGTDCYPGIETLAAGCCLSTRALYRALSGLENCGLLRIDVKASPKHSNLYTFLIPNSATSGTVTAAALCQSWQSNPASHGTNTVPAPALYLPTKRPTKKPTNKRAPKSGALASSFVPPDWVPSEPWQDWLKMRLQMQAKDRPLTQRTLELAVAELAKLRDKGNPPEDVLNQSVLNGWRGLFPLKGDRSSSRNPEQKQISEFDHSGSFGLPKGIAAGRF